jgi:hypothetical protein
MQILSLTKFVIVHDVFEISEVTNEMTTHHVFLSPGVNSRAELIPSPGLTPRSAVNWLGDKGTYLMLRVVE